MAINDDLSVKSYTHHIQKKKKIQQNTMEWNDATFSSKEYFCRNIGVSANFLLQNFLHSVINSSSTQILGSRCVHVSENCTRGIHLTSNTVPISFVVKLHFTLYYLKEPFPTYSSTLRYKFVIFSLRVWRVFRISYAWSSLGREFPKIKLWNLCESNRKVWIQGK